MELLKILKLTRYQRNNSNNPILQLRIKLSDGVSEQIQLAQDSHHKRISQITVADDSGEPREVEVGNRVLRWWHVDVDGTVQSTVRYGSRVLELAKGMDAVELASKDELVPVLKQFKAAVERDEMDNMIAAQLAKPKRVNTIKQQ